MRQSGVWTLSVALLLVSVGCRDAVDPDAQFTITGELLDENGLAVPNAQVTIYKVDYFDRITWQDNAFLHSPSLADQPGLTGVFSTRSDASGNFELTKFGRDFNTAGGGRAAFLTAVFVDPDDTEGMRATASNWFFFDDNDPYCGGNDGPKCHDVGELTLWKETGITATQSGPSINFSWAGLGSPTGYERDTLRPSFLFAYEQVGTMWWGAYTSGTGVTVPRSAFDNDAVQPGFFVVGYSEEISGSRRYMHRTSWQDSAISGYTTLNYGDYFADGAATLIDDGGIGIATDGYFDPATIVALDGQPTALYVDLGTEVSIQEILIYSLGVVNLNDARIEIAISSDPGVSPPALDNAWQLIETIPHAVGFENWVYGGWSGNDTATWVRISVELDGTGQMPYFTFIDEVSVLY